LHSSYFATENGHVLAKERGNPSLYSRKQCAAYSRTRLWKIKGEKKATLFKGGIFQSSDNFSLHGTYIDIPEFLVPGEGTKDN